MAEDQCTVIVAYEVNAEDVDRFLDSWEKAQAHLKKQKGFVSTTLYKAESANPHFRFVNIGCWQDADHFRAATQNSKFLEASASLAPYPIYASAYEVVRS
jgi:heme-degrading monooxygenase HmoA